MTHRKFSRHFPSVLFLALYLCKGLAAASSSQWELGGSFKSIASLEHLKQIGIYPRDWLPKAEERLRLEGIYSRDWFRAEYAASTHAFYQLPNEPRIPIPEPATDSAWNSQWDITHSSIWWVRHRVDRLNVQFNYHEFEMRAGKQVVATGVGRIFAVISQVPRHPFTVVDPEYERTQEALVLSWTKGWGLEFFFLPKVGPQAKHNFQVRAKGSKGVFDLALTSGRSDDKAFVGLEAAGSVEDFLLRAEVAGYNQADEDFLQVLVGWDRALTSTFTMQCEFFYNGFGKSYEAYELKSRPRHWSTPYLGKYYLGATSRWEMNPRTKLSSSALVNLSDPSALLYLAITRSLGDSTDFILGQFLNIAGRDRAEFGGQLELAFPIGGPYAVGIPDLTFAAFRWYF